MIQHMILHFFFFCTGFREVAWWAVGLFLEAIPTRTARSNLTVHEHL